MLAVSPLRSCSIKNESEMEAQGGFSSVEGNDHHESFFGSGDLLESIIDFDDLFVGFSDGDVLPDLEMDSDLVHEFSVVSAGDGISSEMNNAAAAHEKFEENNEKEVVSEREESAVVNPSPTRGEKGRSKSTSKKNHHPGKKKVKVDWTPELHRRFVQAVEQLGVDKAVPSRILELMGIDCLTRHNIASHLQKYRSHRKHLLAREAEAASWSQRRQMYGAAAAAKGEVNPWIAPTMGFPPAAPPPMPHLIRPLHVWGHPHPSADQSLQHMWPKHLAPPPHAWPSAHPLPPPAPSDPSFWHSHHQYVPTPGTPCFAPHLPPTRFPAPLVAGIPSPAMYKVDSGIGMPARQPLPQSPSDVHPSTESIDAAIGDVLRKPWLPLPLGLKPPSTDGVMVELKRQGISKVPPSCH